MSTALLPTPACPTTSADPATSDSSGSPLREWYRRGRATVLIALLVVAATAIPLLAGLGGEEARLDPRSAAPQGARAVAEVLRDQGVEVEVVASFEAALAASGPRTTLVVAANFPFDEEQLRRLDRAEAGALVLLGSEEPSALVPLSRAVKSASDKDDQTDPNCALPVAERAGSVDGGGILYPLDGVAATTFCFSETTASGQQGAGLVQQSRPGGRTVTLLGKTGLLTNDRLDERGNAALALGILGTQQKVVWYLPSAADLPTGTNSVGDLLPDGVAAGAWMTFFAVLIFALWRGRRLGPVVAENLPVVVRAAETTEGRAQLYRRARARDRAAEVLRSASTERLRRSLRLPQGSSRDALLEAVAIHSRRPPAEGASLLYGPAPTTDPALVALGEELVRLEKEVRRP